MTPTVSSIGAVENGGGRLLMAVADGSGRWWWFLAWPFWSIYNLVCSHGMVIDQSDIHVTC